VRERTVGLDVEHDVDPTDTGRVVLAAIERGMSSVAAMVSGSPTGASLTGRTVINTVAVSRGFLVS